MNKGDIIENLEITDIASSGQAVGRHEGRVIFVKGLVPGDVAEVEIYRKRRNFAEARMIRISSPSDFRTSAKCTHFGTCGGCSWQNLQYPKQLRFKENYVGENLKKLSGISLPEISPIIGSDNIYEYRNKLEFTFSNKRWLTAEEMGKDSESREMNALGFHIPGRFDKVLNIDECHLQPEISNKIRNFISAFSIENEISFYDIRNQQGALRNLIIRITGLNELMVVLVVSEFCEKVELLMEEIHKRFPSITSLNYIINTKRNDSISDLGVVCFIGSPFITENLGGLTYKIGPKSFFQTNSKQAEKLYELVRKFSSLSGNEIVYDLYSGAGTIANYLAEAAKKVIGMEYLEEAVADARDNSKLNRIDNCEFIAGDILRILKEIPERGIDKADVIVTDPPRAGMHEDVCRILCSSGADRIVYISCNSATQARDLQILNENYQVTDVQPIDMFPHTNHVENIVRLVRR